MTPETPAITYLRVSTDRQGQSGLGLEAQRSTITAYVVGRPVLGEFVEVENGRKDDRPSSPPRLLSADSAAPCW